MPPSNPEKLLHTKLMPPRLHSAVLQRSSLLSRLDQGLTRKLTLITAPTGYGKTTLVNLWLTNRDTASAWLTLDEYDNDPVRFWTYVVSALRSLCPDLGKTALPLLAASQPIPLRAFMTALINDLDVLERECVLVFEDYHTVSSEEINETFSFLLQHLPVSLHLILISRREPLLPLSILRARDELVELDTAALRFTLPETETFLGETIGRGVPTAVAATLHERTQGWPAGLRLAARLLQDKAGEEAEKLIQSFSGSHRYIADYLINEVFEKQPQHFQQFLLQTCFLERLTGSLCDAVMGGEDGTAVLGQLDRQNLFLTRLETEGAAIWYRYNPLFAESIQYLARQRLSSQDIASIYEKVSGWHERRGQYEEAIETALAARLFQRAITLIEKFIDIHDLTEMHTLSRWLELLPEKAVLLHPEICFIYAQITLFGSAERFAAATAVSIEPYLNAAETLWQQQNNEKRLGQLLSFRGVVSWWQGQFPKAFEYAHQSLEDLPENDLFWRGNSLLIISYEALHAGYVLLAQDYILESRALLGAAQNIYGVLAANQILSQIFYWQGEMEQAEQLNRQILEEAVGEESMLDDQAFAYLGLANIAYERNELEPAQEFAVQAFELAKQRGEEMIQAQAKIRQAYVAAAENDFQQAHSGLKSFIPTVQNPVVLPEVQDAQAHLSILSGELGSLTGWQTVVANNESSGLNVQKEQRTFILARWRIADGRANEALEILENRASEAAERGRFRSQLTALCLEALAHFEASNLTDAAEILSEALTLGQAKGFCRLFLDEGARLAAMLQTLLPQLSQRSVNLYAVTLLHSFNPEQTAVQDNVPLLEPLSPQELRVLRLLAAGLSNREIGEELVVSINTVKTHVKNVYSKLNVSSRDEASEVARGLNLL
ncbi:MAG: LuxR C-terminal-related transcriptional regulator [Candidatus Promineifilaceae bacterium]